MARVASASRQLADVGKLNVLLNGITLTPAQCYWVSSNFESTGSWTKLTLLLRFTAASRKSNLPVIFGKITRSFPTNNNIFRLVNTYLDHCRRVRDSAGVCLFTNDVLFRTAGGEQVGNPSHVTWTDIKRSIHRIFLRARSNDRHKGRQTWSSPHHNFLSQLFLIQSGRPPRQVNKVASSLPRWRCSRRQRSSQTTAYGRPLVRQHQTRSHQRFASQLSQSASSRSVGKTTTPAQRGCIWSRSMMPSKSSAVTHHSSPLPSRPRLHSAILASHNLSCSPSTNTLCT